MSLSFENIEPPDVEPICPRCGLTLNVFGHCRQCDMENQYEADEEQGLDRWKGNC